MQAKTCPMYVWIIFHCIDLQLFPGIGNAPFLLEIGPQIHAQWFQNVCVIYISSSFGSHFSNVKMIHVLYDEQKSWIEKKSRSIFLRIGDAIIYLWFWLIRDYKTTSCPSKLVIILYCHDALFIIILCDGFYN